MELYSFLNSVLFQTVILIITAGITLWIYFANQKQQRKNAVTILLLLIKEIENNIEFLLAEGIVNGLIQEKPLHYSKIIFNENMWMKYAHLIISKISTSTRLKWILSLLGIYLKKKLIRPLCVPLLDWDIH